MADLVQHGHRDLFDQVLTVAGQPLQGTAEDQDRSGSAKPWKTLRWSSGIPWYRPSSSMPWVCGSGSSSIRIATLAWAMASAIWSGSESRASLTASSNSSRLISIMLHGTTAERAGHGPPAGGHPPSRSDAHDSVAERAGCRAGEQNSC